MTNHSRLVTWVISYNLVAFNLRMLESCGSGLREILLSPFVVDVMGIPMAESADCLCEC